MSEIKRGSDWRKWDLHFHTPSSYDYGDNSVTDERIIEVLSDNEIAVAAITDHHVIDVDRVKSLQEKGKAKNIRVLPGIEFLSDSRGKSPIHFIGIFAEDCKLEYIWGQLKNRTNISKIEGEGKKPKEIYCNLETTIALIHELGGITTIHAGEKSNTIENITHSLLHGEAQKTEIAKAIDFYELGKPEDKEGYVNVVFPAIKKHLPMIICSDNHNVNKYILKENCWIKADPTFEGLKQVIYEPKARVRIQSLKPHQKAGYQVIESVKISHSDFVEQTLHLNQSLNAIIGGRSTGKSLLLGAIAKKLNCDKDIKENNPGYADYVKELVRNIVVTWKDGTVNDERDIEYFPQSYMYTLAGNRDKQLDKLIGGIVKQDSEKNKLISSYEAFASDNNTNIMNKVNKLFQLQEDLEKRRATLKEKGDEKGIEAEIEKLTKELADLKSKSEINQSDLKKYTDFKSEKDSLSKTNEILGEEISRTESLKDRFFTNKDLDFDLISLSEVNRKSLKIAFDRLDSEFQGKWDKVIDAIQVANQELKDTNQKAIDQITKDPIYAKGLSAFQNNSQYIDVEEKLKKQKDKMADIKVVSKDIDGLTEQIALYKTTIKNSQREYYNRIDAIKEGLTVEQSKLQINALGKLNSDAYKWLLMQSINQQSYQGRDIVNVSLDTIEDLFKSAHDLFDKLLENQITIKGHYTRVTLCQELMASNFFEISYELVYDDKFSMMSEGKKAFVVLLLLLDFSKKDCPILIDQPEDDLDNRAIYKDLVQYLIQKKKERQILLVTHNPNIVVGSDSELIIVANQNGSDCPNKNGHKFQYVSGSLENSRPIDKTIPSVLDAQGIREHVCEILEGGNDAFKKREQKYSLALKD